MTISKVLLDTDIGSDIDDAACLAYLLANPECNLLGIGPLTNVAALFAAAAEIPSLLKGLVMMCGEFTNRLAGVERLEWNAMLDPTAAAIVYRAAPKLHRSIGMDVTCQVIMSADLVRERFQAPQLRPVLDFGEVSFQYGDSMIFHDPLTAATIFDESICEFERGRVEVELANEQLAGLTRWTRCAPNFVNTSGMESSATHSVRLLPAAIKHTIHILFLSMPKQAKSGW
ncbi:nucleoside hydrolase [bacterium]|nr:MAG: nucleoside hydrolase [bacterium]